MLRYPGKVSIFVVFTQEVRDSDVVVIRYVPGGVLGTDLRKEGLNWTCPGTVRGNDPGGRQSQTVPSDLPRAM